MNGYTGEYQKDTARDMETLLTIGFWLCIGADCLWLVLVVVVSIYYWWTDPGREWKRMQRRMEKEKRKEERQLL